MKLHCLSPEGVEGLEILDILNEKGKEVEKADCNMKDMYLLTTKALH